MFAEGFETLFSRHFEYPFTNLPVPRIRQPLCTIPSKRTNFETRLDSKSQQILVQCTAQEIDRWILNIEASKPLPFGNTGDLGFSGDLEAENHPKKDYATWRNVEILGRIPRIVNPFCWGTGRLRMLSMPALGIRPTTNRHPVLKSISRTIILLSSQHYMILCATF